MDVRCLVCGSEVSEWAGWCPDCGATLEQVGLIEDARPAGDHREETPGLLQPHNRGEGHVRETILGSGAQPANLLRGGRIALAAVVAAVALAVTAGLLVPTSAGHKPGLPAALAREKLFIADPGRTGIFRADGTEVEVIRDLTADGYPSRAVESGSGLVVYVHQGEAYMVPSTGERAPVEVGVADSVFPASDGAVGLFVNGPPGRGFVQFMSAGGQLPEHGTGSMELAGVTPLARLPAGLLIESTPRSTLGTFQLAVRGAQNNAVLGAATQVIDIHATSVAWLSCVSIPTTCSLVVDDTSSDVNQVIPPPPGYPGYAPGGAFSPEGTTLATFVVAGPHSVRLAVINTAIGHATLIGPPLLVEDAVGTATWSADGQWLYYGGDTGGLYAQHIEKGRPIGRQWRLPIQTSNTVTGL
jgi:hypothetical protein